MKRQFTRWIWVLVLVVGASVAVRAQSSAARVKDDPEARAALALLEAQLAAEREERKIPGLSAAVVYDQEILWAKGFGYADLEKKTAATPQTLYRVGSITKLFTATMLMQLRDQGKLQLDDPIVKHLPGFALKSRYDDMSPVTFRQIVSHAAGLPREAPLDYWQTLEFPPIQVVLASLKDAEMTFRPLSEWKYSNLGIALLGHTLGRIAGQPYEDYIQQQILRPLGMNRSGLALTPEMQPYMATGYLRHKEGKPREVAPHPHIGGLVPAGNLYSSVEDIARFISLQFRDAPAGGAQVLRGSSLREMHTVQWMNPDWKTGWGIGFGIERIADQVAVGHSGGIHGFTTNILMVPSAKVGVAVFTNTGTNSAAISRKALELLVPVIQRAAAREQRAEPAPPPEVWKKYIGLYESLVNEVEVRQVGNRLVLGSPEFPEAPGAQLIPEGEHKFRMKGGSVNGELLTFELDAAGNVTRVRVGPYAFSRKK